MQITSPWFLYCLLAVTIPIFIHLFQLRRPKRVFFTNTATIRQVEQITTRQRKVQSLLILLARVMSVAALVLAFCQPFLPAIFDNQSVGTLDVSVDNSFSMLLPGKQGGSRLTEAVEGAKQLGNAVPAGGRLRLLNVGLTPLSKSIYFSKLETLYSAPFKKAGRIYFSSNYGNSSDLLYLISDFQKNAFSKIVLKNILAGRQVFLVPMVGPATGNVYVDSVWVDDAFVRVNTNVGLHIRLRNGGGVAVTECPVKVFLGSRQVAAFRATVAPGQVVTSVLQVQLVDGQVALGRVVTQDAPVVFDNTYCFTLQPAAAIQVLEIGAEPMAQQVYGNEPLFNYHFARVQQVDYGLLRNVNLVLLHELPVFDAGLRGALQAVVARGGSVVVVPAPAVAARASYQQLFQQLGLANTQWEAETASPELREVAMPSAHEPFFRDVFGAQQRAATMPQVAPVMRWSRTGTDILKLRDGESYLADFPSGAGRVYVFSAPFDKKYSDFVTHGLFVPVMYRMAMLSYRNAQELAYRLTQRSVSLTLPAVGSAASADEAGFRLVKDSLTLIPAQRVVGAEVRLELPQGMHSPGFYEIRKNGKLLTTLAFNQDKSESELAAYTAGELRDVIGPNRPNVRVVEGEDIGAGLAKLQTEQTGTPLWRYFLAMGLLALLAETLLVRFGRRPVGASRAAVAV